MGVFILNSVLLGIGLAMDAFSVSLANGLAEHSVSRRKACLEAVVFGAFQAAMPLAGWLCVHTLIGIFGVLEKAVPWVALVLLCFIGGKMLFEGIKKGDGEQAAALSAGELVIQGVATSIDALSVGFTTASYGFAEALFSAIIIAAVTFVICLAGVYIGKKAGTRLANKASVLGGSILIIIGIEIFIKGILQ